MLRANNSAVVHRAVLAGYGIAFLWEQYVADDIRAARLYPLLVDYPSERVQTFVIYTSRRHLAPRTRVVIDFLAEQVASGEALVEEGRVWGDDECWAPADRMTIG